MQLNITSTEEFLTAWPVKWQAAIAIFRLKSILVAQRSLKFLALLSPFSSVLLTRRLGNLLPIYAHRTFGNFT
jgi:hypothetical protein